MAYTLHLLVNAASIAVGIVLGIVAAFALSLAGLLLVLKKLVTLKGI